MQHNNFISLAQALEFTANGTVPLPHHLDKERTCYFGDKEMDTAKITLRSWIETGLLKIYGIPGKIEINDVLSLDDNFLKVTQENGHQALYPYNDWIELNTPTSFFSHRYPLEIIRDNKGEPLKRVLLPKELSGYDFDWQHSILTKASAAFDIHRFRLLAADAERFSNRISEETREKILICCQQGRYPGHAPLGYVNGQSEYGLPWIYPDIQKAFWVAEIFKKFAEGNSLKQLAVWCLKAGLTSVKNNPLSTKAIIRILQNPFYMGQFRHNGKLYAHYYERLVEKDVWEKCQIRLKHYRKNKG